MLDKTGTVTEGKPSVTDIIPAAAADNLQPQNESEARARLLKYAASLEKLSGHPFAAPIVAEAEKAGIATETVENFELLSGAGITGFIGGQKVFGGNARLMRTAGIDPLLFDGVGLNAASMGKTPLYFACGGEYLGAVVLADTIKPSSPDAVSELIKMGLSVVMLTGDNKATAEAIGKKTGIEKVIAEVLPEDKEKEIRDIQAAGKRAVMIGDGINDAPALARADVGIAIGAGTDVAIESADIVLVKSDLADAAAAIRLSRATLRNIKENLFWAFIYNIIGIPLAAAGILSPVIAAAAMSLSSVSVVGNALRLKFVKLKPSANAKR